MLSHANAQSETAKREGEGVTFMGAMPLGAD